MNLRTAAAMAALTTIAACSDAPASADSRTAEETVAFVAFGLGEEGEFDLGREKITVSRENGAPLALSLTVTDAKSNKTDIKLTTTQIDNCNYVVAFDVTDGPAVKVALDLTNLNAATMKRGVEDTEVWLDGVKMRCVEPSAEVADRCNEYIGQNVLPFRLGPLDPKKWDNKVAHQARLDDAVKHFRDNICIAKG